MDETRKCLLRWNLICLVTRSLLLSLSSVQFTYIEKCSYDLLEMSFVLIPFFLHVKQTQIYLGRLERRIQRLFFVSFWNSHWISLTQNVRDCASVFFAPLIKKEQTNTARSTYCHELIAWTILYRKNSEIDACRELQNQQEFPKSCMSKSSTSCTFLHSLAVKDMKSNSAIALSSSLWVDGQVSS